MWACAFTGLVEPGRGVASGPITAGVLQGKTPLFDIWGKAGLSPQRTHACTHARTREHRHNRPAAVGCAPRDFLLIFFDFHIKIWGAPELTVRSSVAGVFLLLPQVLLQPHFQWQGVTFPPPLPAGPAGNHVLADFSVAATEVTALAESTGRFGVKYTLRGRHGDGQGCTETPETLWGFVGFVGMWGGFRCGVCGACGGSDPPSWPSPPHLLHFRRR